jgi:hypothetical protein
MGDQRMTWYFAGKPITETPEEYQGFVYEIHCLATDRLYIGKKNFWRVDKLPPLKGKTRRRHRRTPTDWGDYYGSNRVLLEDIEVYGPESVTRTILVLCANKTQMSYFETKLQFERSVLFDNRYYNDFIGCRITGRGMSSSKG